MSWAAVALSLILAAASRAATETGRPVMRTFTPRVYGADAQNMCAVQDADGLMYFGNTNGVLTFDGATWRVIRTGYSENIRGLALAPDGNIYLGGTRQIGFLRPTEAGREYVSLADRLPTGAHDFAIFWRVVAHGDAVYFATRREVLIWRAGAFTLVPVENASNENVELFAAGDDVYVTAPNRPLQRIRDGRLEVVSDAAFFHDKTICLLEREADGSLLLATTRHGLFRWRDGQAAPIATEVDASLRTPGLLRARRLRDGSFVLILLNQRGTLLVGPDGRFLWRTDENVGLPSQVVFDAVEDQEGGLWLCLTEGLARLEWPSGCTLFDRAQGMPAHGWSMARHDGVFYFGTDEGLFRLVAGSATTGNARFENIMKGRAAALLSDPQGLIVSSNAGIFQLGAHGPEKILTPDKSVFAMLRSTRDPARVWLAGTDEVRSMHRVNGAWRDEGPIAGLPGSRTLVETADGALWTATLAGGANRIRFGTPTAHEPRGAAETTAFDPGTHGLSPKRNTMRVYNWGGNVVLAQGGMGLWIFDAATETFAPLPQTTQQIGNPKQLALFLSASQPDHLWIQRDTNLPRELAIFRVPRTGPPQALPHAFADAAHFARTLLEESNPTGNVLWVSGNDALLRVETAHAFAPEPTLRVLIRSTGLREGERLGPERRTLGFESVAPLFRSGGGAEYQTRLVGFDHAWSDWSEERKRVFTNLGPGAYRFEARARDPDGNVSAVATRTFTIAPPWWRTWWAVGFFSLSGVGGVAGITRWFANRGLKRRVARLEAESAVERERLRLARDLHDEVGSGLGRVILFAGEAERAKGDAAELDVSLARVRTAAQELVQHAQEIVWAVNPQHDTLARVIERLGDYAQDTLRGAGIACTLDAPPSEKIPPVTLGSEARHSLFLAVKEAVHNCVKYAETQTAEFRLRIAGDDFEIVLRDHGRGFAPGERRGSGHGLANIRARAEALGGHAEITGEVGQGTTVTLRVPLPRNFN